VPENLLRYAWVRQGSHDLSGYHVAAEDEGACAVARVFKLASLHFSGSQGQSWLFALQGLHPGQFIGAHRSFALFCQFWGLPIDLTDRPDGFFSSRISRRSQPVPD
jgi:hypothetical protein